MSDKKIDTQTEHSLSKLVPTEGRVTVNKAYKMFVGGAFVRSESGRYFQVKGKGGADPSAVNFPRGSRKDIRDAVTIAKNAWAGWADRTAFNRGQILYRLAEVLESRSEELAISLERSGLSSNPVAEVNAAVDRAVFYAGFADKFQSLVASSNPVSGPHFGFSVPESMGVVGVIAPEKPSLLGLVSTVLPVITGGNTVIALATELDPRTAVLFAECVAASDMPGGVLNILTGHVQELAPVISKHREVVGIDAWAESAEIRTELEKAGADNVKRVKTHAAAEFAWTDERSAQGLGWIERFLEVKSIWHPVGI